MNINQALKDKELFNLCKQVYEATGWDDTLLYSIRKDGSIWDKDPAYLCSKNYAPLYTSDYQLEKLPRYIKCRNEYLVKAWLTMDRIGDGWNCGYYLDDSIYVISTIADTPLKALLKLTIALHEEGLLDG